MEGDLYQRPRLGAPQRVVVDPRPAIREGFEAGLVVVLTGVRALPGGRCRAAFELVGAQVPQPGMTAFGVVPTLDEFEDGGARFGPSLKRTPVDEFAFEGGEEALGHALS